MKGSTSTTVGIGTEFVLVAIIAPYALLSCAQIVALYVLKCFELGIQEDGAGPVLFSRLASPYQGLHSMKISSAAAVPPCRCRSPECMRVFHGHTQDAQDDCHGRQGDKIGETLPTESVPPQSHGDLQMTSRKPSGRDSVVGAGILKICRGHISRKHA